MKLPFKRSRRQHAHSHQGHPHHGQRPHDGVVLAPGTSGSSVFLEALGEATRKHPKVLGTVHLPGDQAAFKRSFGEVLVRFEAHRANAPERVDIARTLVSALEDKLFYQRGDTLEPLREHLVQPMEPVRAEVVGGRGAPRAHIEIPWRQETFRGETGVVELARRMREGHLLTDDAQRALAWKAERVGDGLDLRGERFAMLGAGAELAPTELLLAAGADVLWVDRAPPPERLMQGDFAGRLHAIGASDLLADPRRVRQAIIDFANAGPVHLGLYAYAPGKGRELRLAAVMDAIAKSLPAGTARSVAMLVSPTTPGEVQPEDREAAIAKRERASVWKKALERAGLLPAGAHETVGDATVSRTVVSLQGAAYQAAQYLAKMMSAEVLVADGIGGQPVTVSANVAGITATRSLLHPLFQAAFLGAPRFGIEIYEPATTRMVSGLMTLHDVLNPRAPGAAQRADEPAHERARRTAAQAIHGGARALPWIFEPTIRVAAVLGLGKKPALVAGLIPRRKR